MTLTKYTVKNLPFVYRCRLQTKEGKPQDVRCRDGGDKSFGTRWGKDQTMHQSACEGHTPQRNARRNIVVSSGRDPNVQAPTSTLTVSWHLFSQLPFPSFRGFGLPAPGQAQLSTTPSASTAWVNENDGQTGTQT